MGTTYQKALKHFKRADAYLYSEGLKIDPIILNPSNDHFADLCKSIIYQQLSVLAGQTILNKFKLLFPNETITSGFLIKLEDEKIRNAGISYTKIKYLKDIAQKVNEKEIMLEELENMDNQAIIETLTKVKGIGKWTAEMFLMFSLGRIDIFSAGDLGLREGIKRLYKLKERPSIAEAEKRSLKWSPYKTYASMILWRSLKP